MEGRASRDLEIAVLDERDIPACIAIAQDSFDEFSRQPAAVEQWFQARVIDNPWQHHLPGIGVGIRDQGELVGFRAMFAQPWWMMGRSTVIAFAAHTAVKRQVRGQGLGTRMIDASRSFAAFTGSTSAGDITQKSYARLGFTAVGGNDNSFFQFRSSFRGSMQRRIGRGAGWLVASLLDEKLFLRDRRLGSVAGYWLQEAHRCDEEFDQLWARVRPGYSSCLERSSRYLNWRLFDAPTCVLRLSVLRDSAGRLRAGAVWRTTRFSEFIQSAVVRDLVYPADDEAALKALLGLLTRQWRADGISWVQLEVTSPRLEQLFHALEFAPVPSNGNRYQVHGDASQDKQVFDHWFRSGLDGDYFDLQAGDSLRPAA